MKTLTGGLRASGSRLWAGRALAGALAVATSLAVATPIAAQTASRPAARPASAAKPVAREDVNRRNPDGSTPLQWAVYTGNVAEVKRLLRAGAKV